MFSIDFLLDLFNTDRAVIINSILKSFYQKKNNNNIMVLTGLLIVI